MGDELVVAMGAEPQPDAGVLHRAAVARPCGDVDADPARTPDGAARGRAEADGEPPSSAAGERRLSGRERP